MEGKCPNCPLPLTQPWTDALPPACMHAGAFCWRLVVGSCAALLAAAPAARRRSPMPRRRPYRLSFCSAAVPPAEPSGARKDVTPPAEGATLPDTAAPGTPAAAHIPAMAPLTSGPAPTTGTRGGGGNAVYAGLVGLLAAASPPLILMPQLVSGGGAGDGRHADACRCPVRLPSGTQCIDSAVVSDCPASVDPLFWHRAPSSCLAPPPTRRTRSTPTSCSR